jgi:hypothetical protein
MECIMTTATINGNAGGVWVGEEGTVVEVLERSPNGRASRVRMPEDPQRLPQYARRRVWLPSGWLDGEVEASG